MVCAEYCGSKIEGGVGIINCEAGPESISAPFNSFLSQSCPVHLPLCLQLNNRFLGMYDAPFEDSTVYLNDAIGKVRLVG